MRKHVKRFVLHVSRPASKKLCSDKSVLKETLALTLKMYRYISYWPLKVEKWGRFKSRKTILLVCKNCEFPNNYSWVCFEMWFVLFFLVGTSLLVHFCDLWFDFAWIATIELEFEAFADLCSTPRKKREIRFDSIRNRFGHRFRNHVRVWVCVCVHRFISDCVCRLERIHRYR